MTKSIGIDYSQPCKIKDCEKTSASEMGLCFSHYQMYRSYVRKGLTEIEAIEVLNLLPRRYKRVCDKTCTQDNCDKPHYAKGLCRVHYTRTVRNSTKID
jgi:hypothetical protein